MKLKYAYGIVPGVSGSDQETECQDKIKILEEHGVSVISCGMDGAAAVITERFEEFYTSGDDVVKSALKEPMTEASGSDNSPLFVAVKENRYLAGHMGGGLIAVLNDGCSVLSKPETKDKGQTGLRVYRDELKRPFGFMLLSDGACLSLYEYDTGSLSPACGTFFEWLKEYDEETVSDALADNIDKYFVRETKGDISVAIMITNGDEIAEDNNAVDEIAAAPPEEDELDAEEAESADEPKPEEGTVLEPSGPVEAAKPVGETAKSRNYIKYLIAVALVVILAVVAVLMNQAGDPGQKEQGKAEVNPPAAASEGGNPAATSVGGSPATPSENSNSAALSEKEPSVSFSADNPKSYDAGVYQVGEDIPAGEYFFWTGEMLTPDSVKINDFTCLSGELYCLTVQVNEGDTLTSNYRFTAAENVNPIKAASGILISGKYKIGKDIAPGTYQISPLDQNAEGKYYSILNGEISNDETFSGETTVKVPEEGYIVFYNSALTIGRP